MSWANSILCHASKSVNDVIEIQNGRILCEIIDILQPEARLITKAQVYNVVKYLNIFRVQFQICHE